jgi:glutamate-1-semialdehyde 2,1-aminomutase
VKRGVAMEQAAATLVFDYNDLPSLQRLFDEHPGEIAAVMLEPATHITPAVDGAGMAGEGYDAEPRRQRGFLHEVQDLARANGALFILDEMITGFRWRLAGAQDYFGVQPDLATFGKAMANGFSLAAMVGRREVMEVGSIDRPGMERTFLLSTTHGGEMPALGAFIEATRINAEEDVPGHLWRYGARLRDTVREVAARHGLTDHFLLEGPPIALNYVTRGADGAPSPAMRTLFAQEMLKRGVMMPWITFSQAHGDEELAITAVALDGAFEIYARALEDGVERFLVGDPVKPVFRTHN